MAKTTTTIGTVTVTANYEATPEGFHPDGSLHIASDGRAIVVYAYWLYNSWRFAFRSSDPTKTTWTDETVILNPDNQHSGNNINRIASCMDASGHVYVAMLYYENKGYGRSFIKYCKLTKAGAGWSAGSVSAVCEDWNSLAPKWQTLHVAHDGEWPFIGQNGYVSQNGAAAYAVLYPQSPPYWTSCYGNGNMNDANMYVALGMGCGGGYRLFAWKQDYLANRISCCVGYGKDGNGYPRWANASAAEVLWEGTSLVSATENWAYFGINILYLGHPLVDFVVIARLTDGSLRLKKYKIGTGWTGEVTLRASGVVARSTQAVWDANTGLLHFWYNTTSSPGTYNPSDDTVDVSAMDVRTTVMWPYFVDGFAYGYKASGASGVSTQSLTYQQRAYLVKAKQAVPTESLYGVAGPVSRASFESRVPLFRVAALPAAATGWVYPEKGVPAEYRWMLVRPRSADMVYETLAQVRLGRGVPFDAQSQLQNGVSTYVLPLDIRTAWGRDASLPIEWRQAWPARAEGPPGREMWLEILRGVWGTNDPMVEWNEPIVVVSIQDCPLEIPGGVGTLFDLPFESAMGVSDSVYHSWSVLEQKAGVLPHLWRVMDATQFRTVRHRWTVRGAQGGRLPHLWRVMPRAFVVLGNPDIQLPYGTVEKTA